jgi:Na+-transporting methylmalonyl-CoA/oxaloacetate decarboxylase gamma subunit
MAMTVGTNTGLKPFNLEVKTVIIPFNYLVFFVGVAFLFIFLCIVVAVVCDIKKRERIRLEKKQKATN